jgi:transcriptional regulator with XRE-family HTH domain
MDADRINRDIGRRLKMRRRLLDLSQKEVAQRCGLKLQQIHKYEAGLNTISAAKLVMLAQALEVSANYFFDGLEAGFPLNGGAESRLANLSPENCFNRDAA